MAVNEPAFPGQELGPDGLPCVSAATGLTKREWFAGMALPLAVPLIANSMEHGESFTEEDVAAMAFRVADALLSASGEEG